MADKNWSQKFIEINVHLGNVKLVCVRVLDISSPLVNHISLLNDYVLCFLRCDELQLELTTQKEEATTTIRNMQTKYDANMEYMKQEEKVSASRVCVFA